MNGYDPYAHQYPQAVAPQPNQPTLPPKPTLLMEMTELQTHAALTNVFQEAWKLASPDERKAVAGAILHKMIEHIRSDRYVANTFGEFVRDANKGSTVFELFTPEQRDGVIAAYADRIVRELADKTGSWDTRDAVRHALSEFAERYMQDVIAEQQKQKAVRELER